MSLGERGRWVFRPWWIRASAASAVAPPFAIPILCCLAVLGALRPTVSFRPAYAVLAAVFALAWLLSASAWIRVGPRGLLFRHLWRVHRIPWEAISGCATVWAEQGRKQVRVVAVERAGELVLLWPTAWIGEPNRRALVGAVHERRNQVRPQPEAVRT